MKEFFSNPKIIGQILFVIIFLSTSSAKSLDKFYKTNQLSSYFSGILLFTLGIIGIYLARIFEQTKGRNQYVIKNIKDYK